MLEPKQPEYTGRPVGSTDTIWTFEELERAGVTHPWRANESGEKFVAILVSAVRAPSLLRRIGPYEL